MATTMKYKYKDEQGRILPASQARILERRKLAAKWYDKWQNKYATYRDLYIAIGEKLTSLGYPCNFDTVRNDLKTCGIVNNTRQTRMPKRKEE